jgi:pimeloyl-ACP methyl ester carboxylesterase
MGLTTAAGIALEDHAPEDATGLPLLLVHGAGGTRLHWPAELRHLPGRRVLSVDLPGHGGSAPPAERTVAGMALRLAGVLDALGIPRAAVGGHSLGGAVALTLALDAPGRVAGLLLVGTGARLRVVPEILAASADPGRAREVADALAAVSFGAAAPAAMREELVRGALAQAPGVVHADFTACDGFDAMARLGLIRAPARVVVGAEDRLTPPRYGAFLREALPGEGMDLVPGAGHMVAWEAPGVVAAAAESLLAGIS